MRPLTIGTRSVNCAKYAGAVISDADDMHAFIEALVRGDLFHFSETLGEMKATVPTTNPTLMGYGLGLALKGQDI